MTTKLLTDSELERSSVVANCCMNRERGLRGTNGYDQELQTDPLKVVLDAARLNGSAAWLDLCCGSGKALVEAATILATNESSVQIVGVDLAGRFAQPSSDRLELTRASLTDWTPSRTFDLVTCVHGLHYVGDKVGLIARAVSWLSPAGAFVANLDSNNLKMPGRPDGRPVVDWLRRNGFRFSSRHHLLRAEGSKTITSPFDYLGANDTAGPNYTGQDAVDSHYRKID